MNRARFQRMKRTAFFINIGRGRTTRLDDLVAALRSRRDRRRRARRLRAGAAAGRSSAVDDARRAHHAAHRRPRPVPRRAPLRDHARQLPALPGRPAAAQRGGQGQLVLRGRRNVDGPGRTSRVADRRRDPRRRRQEARRRDFAADIYRAWLGHNVVVVPGQDLAIEDFLSYSRRFGFVSPHPSKMTRHPDYPKITLLGVDKFGADGRSTWRSIVAVPTAATPTAPTTTIRSRRHSSTRSPYRAAAATRSLPACTPPTMRYRSGSRIVSTGGSAPSSTAGAARHDAAQ